MENEPEEEMDVIYDAINKFNNFSGCNKSMFSEDRALLKDDEIARHTEISNGKSKLKSFRTRFAKICKEYSPPTRVFCMFKMAFEKLVVRILRLSRQKVIVRDGFSIKIKTKNKCHREFEGIFCVQSTKGLDGEDHTLFRKKVRCEQYKKNEIGIIKYSVDGKYIAIGGQNPVVVIMRILENVEFDIERRTMKILDTENIKRLKGHTSNILDVVWSKNNFILTCSMDKTARLWHVSRKECLVIFKHRDFVTSASFHPHDDRYFVTGSLDGFVRVFSIQERKCVFARSMYGSFITTVNFNLNGKIVMVGTYDGKCYFYETYKLKYITQFPIKMSSRLKKINSIESMAKFTDACNKTKDVDEAILVTSNDSTIRMFNLRDKTLISYFRGFKNRYSQLRASFNYNHKYIVCGSEDRWVYIWNTNAKTSKNPAKLCPNSYEAFTFRDASMTCATFAPEKMVAEIYSDAKLSKVENKFIILSADTMGNIIVWMNLTGI